ncbi:MAG: SCP2 sterol-binding domain-containing protein [Promethearchaeota archaeon]|jgi:DNA polymerase III sliding clamp (beta) subunit (PCNA family)
MLDSKSFRSVVLGLEDNNEEFIAAVDRIIKFTVNIIKNSEELSEEIKEYDDIYQVLIPDINYNFWIKVSKGIILYKKGINQAASFRIRYHKKIFIKILKGELNGTDAYMKGKIKVDGDLTQGLRFTKLFRLFIEYINKLVQKGTRTFSLL